MDDHQTVNARALSSLDAADILPESEFTPERVKSTLEARLNDSKWLKNASRQAKLAGRPDAAAKLAELVISAVK
jgi:UDP-N-acetylglucosamine--N-acetylmuramyl-(pentapeptide) pyrophosphoryl-undecaprenol N-acetylglucosamine transferase